MTTPDQTTTGQYADIRARALAAATAVFDRHLNLMAPPPHVVEEAFDAADQVYTQYAEAETERIVAETGWLGMDIVDGAVRMRLKHAHDFAAAVVASFDEMTRAVGAENYTETEVTITAPDPENPRKYTFIVVKPGKRSPHQLRQDAENERDRARAQLAGLHAELSSIYPDVTTESPSATLAAVRARFAEERDAATAEVDRLRAELAAIAAIADDPADDPADTLRFISRRAKNGPLSGEQP